MISTHILNLNTGLPAKSVNVRLELRKGDTWSVVKETTTNDDGRISFENEPLAGDYRLVFEIESYLKSQGQEAFFKVAPVEFFISDTNRKYHIPLLLNNYGYSTYRGS